jgi:hypothetical protein
MLKVALLAAAAALVAPAATATDAAVDSATTPTIPAESPCRPGPAPELGCPLHPADVAPADLAGLAVPDNAPIDTSLPRPAGDIAFKDATADTASVLPASVDRDRSQRLAPALLALGALVILLRRRPH